MAMMLIVILSLVALSCGFSFDVGARSEGCFYEMVDKDKPVGVMFQVIAGGFLDIDVRILGPDGRQIYTGSRETDGRYSFTAHLTGTYTFCFSNAMSAVTPKTVDLSVTVGQVSEMEKGDVASDAEVSPLSAAVIQLSDAITAISNDQRYLKMREEAHRNTNESTNERVLWWSMFEIVVLLSMSIWQIYYLRRFFEDKRAI